MTNPDDLDMVWGWTKQQYCVAWTYFDEVMFLMDATSQEQRQSEQLLSDLATIQNRWREVFPSDPCTGPMQLYTPEVPAVVSSTIKQVFMRLRLLNKRQWYEEVLNDPKVRVEL